MLTRLRNLRSRASAWLTLLAIPALFAVSLYEPDGGDGGGATGGGEGGGAAGGGEGGGAAGGAGGAAGGGAAGGDADKSFTQADVDRIVQERLARAKTAPPADYEDLKKKAQQFDELEVSKLDDLQKAQKALADAETARDAAIADSREQAMRNAVYTEAVVAKAIDPADVYALLPKDAVTVGNDGQVTGVKEAVKALLEAKPHLVGKTTTPAGSADGGTRTSGGDTPKNLEGAITARIAQQASSSSA